CRATRISDLHDFNGKSKTVQIKFAKRISSALAERPTTPLRGVVRRSRFEFSLIAHSLLRIIALHNLSRKSRLWL
ncbi:MAG: hypothetical protein K2N06_06725, partial [Oscillospiraceae bacterium]|nr:hypothetical protein [Oscillospiraceae bacterium]